MKNVASLLVLSLMAVSCINLEGTLNVSQVMSAKKKGGFLNLQTKSVQIQPGSYAASLKVNNSKSFTLKLKSSKEDESDILIPIKSEKEFALPTNGAISILGTDIAQPFDLAGNIETTVTESDVVKTDEGCTYNTTERRCDNVCSPAEVVAGIPRDGGPGHDGPGRPGGPGPGDNRPGPGHDGPGPGDNRPTTPPRVICRVVCNDVIVTVNGKHYVEYHTEYTQRNLIANLIKQDSKDTLATFTGTDTDSQRINDYVGECR